MTTISKSARAMNMAHILYKKRIEERTSMIAYDPQLEWKNALKRGWYFVRFNEWLSGGIVKFSFFKKDGSIREAVGTKDLRIIPKEKWPKGADADHMPNYSTVTFFDLDKQEWRSFDITRFIGFVTIYELKEKA